MAPRALLIFEGIALVLWSLASVPIVMASDLIMADWPMWFRLTAILLVTTAVAAPLLLVAYRRWRLFLWLAALAACLVMVNVPWCAEKAFYLRAERAPRGATVEEVRARMEGYSTWSGPKFSGTTSADLVYDWDGNLAIFTFEGGRLKNTKLIPD